MGGSDSGPDPDRDRGLARSRILGRPRVGPGPDLGRPRVGPGSDLGSKSGTVGGSRIGVWGPVGGQNRGLGVRFWEIPKNPKKSEKSEKIGKKVEKKGPSGGRKVTKKQG